MRYGMVIDLKKCVSCYACMIACKQADLKDISNIGVKIALKTLATALTCYITRVS